MKKELYILNIKIKKNNLFCCLTNLEGDVLWWTNKGKIKNKNTKRIIPSMVNNMLSIINNNKQYFYVKMKGINKQNLNIVKTLQSLGIKIFFIEYSWNIPHNGCKQKKRRCL